MKSSNSDLAAALRILAHDIESKDGVANAVCCEAADRIDELSTESNSRFEAVSRLQSTLEEEREMRDMLNETIAELEREVDRLKQSRKEIWRNWHAAIRELEEIKEQNSNE